MAEDRRRLLESLREKLRLCEQGPKGRLAGRALVPGGEVLDSLLPGGLAPAMVIEWLGIEEGSGATTLALLAAWRARREKTLVIVDPAGEFFPPAAAAMGIDLESIVLVQPVNVADLAWATDESLRSPAPGAVLVFVDRAPSRVFQRWRLAARQDGGIGILVRPASARSDLCWVDARLEVEPIAGQEPRTLRVTLARTRHGQPGKSIAVEVEHETGAVRLVSALFDRQSAQFGKRGLLAGPL